MTRSRRPRAVAVVFALAVAMLVVAGVTITSDSRQDEPVRPGPVSGPAAAGQEPVPGADLAATTRALQQRLDRLPGDYTAWASLGLAYVQQARITGDPTYYPKAEGALENSLARRPAGNDAAHTGLASLAAARHDFHEALRQARHAQRLNPYGAANQGVLGDALIELGRYEQAFAELQRMVDLQPGVASFTRVSYAWELRGEVGRARGALERALDFSTTPSDAAYCLYHLGELAWNSGQLDAAEGHYTQGVRRDPGYAPLIAGQAKVAAARGDAELALDRYREVVRRRPEPSYVIAYAELLAALGRDERATRQYAVVDATRRLYEAQGVRVDLEIALFDADTGHPDAALEAARAAWRQRRTVHTEDAYAWALHASGRDRDALPHARAAARLGTKSAQFAYHRGMIERALGRYGSAEAALQRALRLNPYFSPLHAPRARAALDDPAAAR
ncbi:MAG: tetratricopeptide repeat protein [Carbonactinosporaceae bacterium]